MRLDAKSAATRTRMIDYARAMGATIGAKSGEAVSVEFRDWAGVLDWCTYAALDAAEREPELVSLALDLGTPAAVVEWVRRHIEWRNEPNERLSYPTSTLSRGWGDCDDHAVVTCALVSALGYRAAVVGLTLDGVPVHAATALYASTVRPEGHDMHGRGAWWWLDTTAGRGIERWDRHPLSADQRPGLRGLVSPRVVEVPRW